MHSNKRRTSSRLSYSIDRLAAACDVGRSLLYEEIAAGRLTARKVGRRTIVTRSDAIRWLRGLPEVGVPSTIGSQL